MSGSQNGLAEARRTELGGEGESARHERAHRDKPQPRDWKRRRQQRGTGTTSMAKAEGDEERHDSHQKALYGGVILTATPSAMLVSIDTVRTALAMGADSSHDIDIVNVKNLHTKPYAKDDQYIEEENPMGGKHARKLHDPTQILDEDHYGLADVKSCILKFLAISKLRGTVQRKIICLVASGAAGLTIAG
ncbi:hypothetical protein BDZ97DRAFT_1765767 [Flammula alnicola]|nr:hypothetical protein BDZ97DRAFT_1765767 [Flammula alnicola]